MNRIASQTQSAASLQITVANILKTKVPPAAIEKIKHISNLNEFNLSNIFECLKEYGITFPPTNQQFEDIFSCNTKTRDRIFIVSTNYVHKHE